MITNSMINATMEPRLNLRLLRLRQEVLERYAGIWKDFTDRELEIIDLIAEGFNSLEIGEQLFISKHTVDTHRKNIYRKGGFTGVRDVILFSLLYDNQGIGR